MKWRIVDHEGKTLGPCENFEHVLSTDGTVLCINLDGNDWYKQRDVTRYTLEFALEKDDQGNWLYEHCVMCK